MMDFELGDELISIKSIGEIEAFKNFKIKGSGDLTFRTNSGKSGFGFEVHHQITFPKDGRWVNTEFVFYFTENEMKDYFMPLHYYWDNIQSIRRELKIEEILKNNF
jgi:hypothetical protein